MKFLSFISQIIEQHVMLVQSVILCRDIPKPRSLSLEICAIQITIQSQRMDNPCNL